MQTLIKVEWV